jgi:hypothetical protein
MPLPHQHNALRGGGQPHEQVLLQVLVVVGSFEELVVQQLQGRKQESKKRGQGNGTTVVRS